MFIRTLLVATALATNTAAQGPPPGTPPGVPLSDQAAAESLKVLTTLDSLVRAKPRNADAWHRRGIVAWSLTYRGRIGPRFEGLDWTRTGRIADSSIRIALNLDPSNPRIVLTAAQFYISSGQTAVRVQAYRHIDRAYNLAKRGRDSALHAEAAIERGRMYWRRYDTFANRRISSPDGAFERSLASRSDGAGAALGSSGNAVYHPAEIMKRLNQATQALPADMMGEADYELAEALFREAYAFAPRDSRAFHELAMLLATKKRWQELATLARDRVRRIPADPTAWLALGLTAQRMKKTGAGALFDTALANMESRERAHFTSLRRVIPTQDERRYASLTSEERERDARMYWQFTDPLWSRGGSDAYTEFLTRATYADLRWTVPELGVRGIDSDRGEMHIRYGPPDVEAVLGPQPTQDDIGAPTTSRSEMMTGDQSSAFGIPDPTRAQGRGQQMTSLTTLWAYDTGWLIIFRGAPTYATAQIPPEDIPIVDSLIRATPASWRGAREEVIVDMPAQVARFRAGGDSLDIVVAAEPPVNEMREATGANVLVRTDFWLFARDRANTVHDSSTVRAPGARAWRVRMPSGADYAYRVEATADGAMVAGRATDWIDTSNVAEARFTTRGPGISDVMLVNTATPKQGARRWNEIDVEPTAGTVKVGGQIALVWENYDLGQADGSAKYSVSVAIERRYKQTLNRIRARVIGAFAAIAGVQRTEDRVIYSYDRTVAHAPILLDYLTLDLADTPAGEYRLTVDIKDQVTGRMMTRIQRFVIRE